MTFMIQYIFGFAIPDPKHTVARISYLWTVTIISRTVPVSILSEYGVVDLDLGRGHSLPRLPAPVGGGGPRQRAQIATAWR